MTNDPFSLLRQRTVCVKDDEHNYLTVIVLIKAKKQAVNEKFRSRPIECPLEEP
jgi:hypothetical protein